MKSYFLHLGIAIFLLSESAFAVKPVIYAGISLDCSESAQKKLTNAVKANDCKTTLPAFRGLYLCLQRELDYDGKNTLVDKKGKAIGSEDKAIEGISKGQQFEKMLTKEFKNSLKKIIALYQSNKADLPAPIATSIDAKNNIDMLRVLDPTLKEKDDKDINYPTFFKNLLAQSKKKFEKTTKDQDKQFLLNERDIYLLEKLLIHAQDRICLLRNLEVTKKGTKYFTKEYLESVKQSPINKLLSALNSADKMPKENIDINIDQLADEDTTINKSVEDALKKIKNFYTSNKKCLEEKGKGIRAKSVRNSIQDNIQVCNYNKFLDSLSLTDERNIESILHFINANEQLKGQDGKVPKGHPKTVADTGLGELKVDDIIKTIIPPAEDCTKNPNTESCCIKTDTEKDKHEFIGGQCKVKAPSEDCVKNPNTESCCIKTDTEKDKHEFVGGQCKVKVPSEDCAKNPNTESCCIKTDTEKDKHEFVGGQCKIKASPASPVADPAAECEKKNFPDVDGIPSANSTHQFSWNADKKTCDKKKADDKTSTAEPDSPAAEPTEREKATGMPVRSPDIQMPPRPSMGVLRGLQ